MRRPPFTAPAVMAAVGAAVAAVPVVELRMARRGPKLVELDHILDGTIGTADPTSPAVAVTWLGDSTAAGVGADTPDGALPRQVATAVGHPMNLRVLARSGARIADVVADQLPRLDPTACDLIVVSVGANDVAHLTRRRDFVRDYNRMLDAAGDTPVVVLSVPDMASALILAQPLRAIVGARARLVDGWIRGAIAGRPGVHYVDICSRPDTIGRRVADYLSADRYHPNEAGYAIWATAVAAAVTNLIGTAPAGA